MWVLLAVCLILGGSASSLRCPDGHECEEPRTCCRLSLGHGYTCCDQPQFPGISLHMFPPATLNEDSGVVCPNGRVCPLEYSCLRTPDASYGCCPWGEAVSCADGRHCCPRGFHCSADGRSCFQSQGSPPPSIVDAVQCPDGESQCPNESTCCLMADGSWGCCPIPEASCCPDKIHCCPHSTTCDMAHSRCLSASGEQPLRTKFPASKKASVLALAQKNICPNNSTCPDTATCCQLPTSQYGCCPLQNAVCCSDQLHCCPQGTTCDLTHSKCTLTPGWSRPLTRLLENLQKARDVQCDAEHKCPDGNTCCRKASGTWGCCPLEEAVCCPDHVHCCPKSYTCNLAEGTCEKAIDTLAKPSASIASVVAAADGSVVPCDPQTTCPDGNTCCRLPTGAWGCCPLPQAVCCQDHLHCCPNGFRCGPGGTCTNDTDSVPWVEKRPAIVHVTSSNTDVRCDDQVSCPDGSTCCRLASGAWGCCPLPQAVCCQDHLHCCPNGFRCGPGGTCTNGTESVPWVEKRPAIVHVTSSNTDVKCDDQVSCPDGSTCCRLASGAWGCCPLPQAVCCQDHLHCCPNGFRCGSTAGTCVKDGKSIPWLEKRPAIVHATKGPSPPWLLAAPSPTRLVHCDDQTSCEDGQTCCQLGSGAWGCCPFPEALCCADHVHCCPKDYSCDVAHGSCLRHVLSWGPGRPADPLQNGDVRCDDTTSCEEGQTCCKSKTGSWSCCQLPNAVCCADHQHCCPSGYTCNLKAQTCEKQGPQSPPTEAVQPSVRLSPSDAATFSRDVPCDAQHYCRDKQTCCQTRAGAWACCPYDKGSCCPDKRHCCPSSFRCSRSGSYCVRKGPLRWDADVISSHFKQALPLL